MCSFAASLAPDTENWRSGGGLREINVCTGRANEFIYFSVRFMGRNGKFVIQSVKLRIITARKISNRNNNYTIIDEKTIGLWYISYHNIVLAPKVKLEAAANSNGVWKC